MGMERRLALLGELQVLQWFGGKFGLVWWDEQEAELQLNLASQVSKTGMQCEPRGMGGELVGCWCFAWELESGRFPAWEPCAPA